MSTPPSNAGAGPDAGGQVSMQQMLQEAQMLQQHILQAQEQLAESQVEGSAGGGIVRARVNGVGEVTGIWIAPEALQSGDAEMLADLVLAAIRDGADAASDLQQQVMGPLTSGLGLPE